MFATLDNAQSVTMEALQQQLDNAPKNLQVTIANAVKGGFTGGVQSGLVGLQTTLDAIDANKTMTGDQKEEATQNARMVALRETTNLLAEDLKKLGPEGELVASVAQGALVMADAFDTMTTSIEEGGSKMAARAQFAAAAISQISTIMAANSKAQIAEIDKQIEAEKKRDGKSAESVAKIKAMEKKKEAMERKAFERNKKMQMAQTIASTAAGIAGVLAGIKDPIVTAPLAFATAVMIGAMGAAQLAIISKQKYSGGSGSVEKPSGQTLSIGKRDNTVDVSRGASRGELAYMRGERGVGSNANDFRPTGGAYGMKNYAAGGEGILVGEQGPEIVTPTQPVDVTPMTSGGAQNVTFTINAVDAEGVEAVLERQRGNIIGMIRSAANGYGQNFLEQVDTDIVSDVGYQKA
jgi:hypothetical protein